MKKYKQLVPAQRYQIEALLTAGHNQSEIATIIGVHRSTVSRELKRNIGSRGSHAGSYLGRLALRKASQRHSSKNKAIRFTEDLKEQAASWLRNERLSPELIAVEWNELGINGVSAEWIYQWIWASKLRSRLQDRPYKDLYGYLRHGRRHARRGNHKSTRGAIKNRVSIEQRPKIVDERSRLGDIEVDLMMGKDHKSALLVMVDRATLITKMDKLEGKDADRISEIIQDRIQKIGSSWIKTMTFDNGKEFSKHQDIADKHGVKTFFTRPYTSQDKGTVENRIGVIRRWLPKGTDLREVSDKEIKKIQSYINKRRIKKFGYISPIDKLKSTWPVALMS